MNDYNELAELAGLDYLDMTIINRQKSPSMKLLNLLTTHHNGCAVGKLWMSLHMMGRFDMMAECKRQIVSTSDMEADETQFATVQDVESGQKTFYDAFICYSAEDENDRKFVLDMVDEMEKKRGLQLFIPGRDDLPGSAEHTVTAYIIEKRCKHVVIVISKKFLESEACDFQVKFAHALSPGARNKKLIPVIRERNTAIPSILRFLGACDFTRSDMDTWVWNRLCACISAPVGHVTNFKEEDSSDPFDMDDIPLKALKYPRQRRLVENNLTDAQSSDENKTTDAFASRERQSMEYSLTSMSLRLGTVDNQTQNDLSTKYISIRTVRSFFQRMCGSPKQSKSVPRSQTNMMQKIHSAKHSNTAFNSFCQNEHLV